MRYLLFILMGAAALSACAAPEAGSRIDSEKHRFSVQIVTRGLEHPWGMAFLPDGGILVTERPGRLRVIRDGELAPQAVTGLPEIRASGQGGLLDVALHPDFAQNQWVYLSYAAAGEGGIGTEVARGRFDGQALRDVEVIFRALPKRSGGRHFGSRLLFTPDGYLYITLGDRGHRPNGQDPSTHPGSVIRLHDDGSVPADNPFVNDRQRRPEIFTYGNRNVQGIALEPGTGRVWAHEHGPQGGDEVNILRSGVNYGWATITYGVNYGVGTKIGEGTEKEGMAQPVWYWVPSIGPSGMTFYNGDRFPKWRGNLFVGSLKFELLVRLEVDGDTITHEERMLENTLGRIRDVRQGPDGYLYLLIDAGNGFLARIVPD